MNTDNVNTDKKRIVVGMSGGVDSSVSLLLLKNKGFEPIGVSLKYDVWQDECNSCRENICCSKESFAIAKNICNQLGVAHHIVDVSREFKKEVIDYFIKELKANSTPSPCVFCNPKVKFKSLIKFADKHKIRFVATGHYARIKELRIKNQELRKYELLKAKDEKKDQTYSLSFLTQKELSRIIFPLGELTKMQVYEIAKKQRGFEIFEKRKQSQDFCFISGDLLPRFLEKEIGTKKGSIKDTADKIVGTHEGLHFYTIGQRKGIGIGGTPPVAFLSAVASVKAEAEGGPYYVVEKDVDTNTLVISRDRSQFAKEEVNLKPFNLISGGNLEKPIKVMTKIRSGTTLQEAVLMKKGEFLHLKFANKQASVTPGQIAVFYDGEICLGAGVISKV